MRFIFSFLITVVIWAVALIPLWIFLGAKSLANPDGFWQNIVLFGLGLWVLGGIQVVLFIGGVAVTVVVWLQMYDKRG
ncbi:MAG: hypothetical protein Q8Q89_03900 [bacterium]|nr:hypothetical protein [bacterium]